MTQAVSPANNYLTLTNLREVDNLWYGLEEINELLVSIVGYAALHPEVVVEGRNKLK